VDRDAGGEEPGPALGLRGTLGHRQPTAFEPLGIDSDNGSEFINDHRFRYCLEHGITFTRSRPYRKNDNCFVEQKKWDVPGRSTREHFP
jgi:transposase InsO family protein